MVGASIIAEFAGKGANMRSTFVAALLLMSSPCFAQTEAATATTGNQRLDTLVQARHEAEVYAMAMFLSDGKPQADKPDPTPRLLRAYSAVVDDSDSARLLLSNELGEYLANKHSTKSAAQASQLAQQSSLEIQIFQAVQNQRIIDLLKELVRARNNSPAGTRPSPVTAPKK